MAMYTLAHGYQKTRVWPRLLAFSLAGLSVIGFAAFRIATAPTSKAISATVMPTLADEPKPIKKISFTAALKWPSYGQAAYGVVEDGVLAQSSSKSQPVPVASVAKVFTALMILRQKPLAPGEQGPLITLTPADEALYQEYVAKQGTVVPVKAGEQISEYQALQALLLPSANNIADTLVRWAFGSMDNYNNYANQTLKSLDFTQTTISGASGYAPTTTSTADEIVKAGILYMQNPVLREIASQSDAVIPVAGKIENHNTKINQDGILGIKVGYTDQARSTFLVADVKGDTQDNISVAAVLGADTLETAMKDARSILTAGNEGHAAAMQAAGSN